MGYKTWATNGYGMSLAYIDTTLETLTKTLDLAPKAKEELLPVIKEYLENEGLEAVADATSLDTSAQDVFDEIVSDEGYLLAEVLGEVLGTPIDAVDDFDGNTHIIYVPRYPWHASPEERALTITSIQEAFEKVMTVADPNTTKKDIRELLDDQCVMNGG